MAPLVISLFLHLIFAVLVVLTIRQGVVEDDAINVEWVELSPSARTLPRKVRLQPVQSPRQVQDRQPQELPLQTVTRVGTPLAVDLPQERNPLSLSDAPAISLDKGLSVEANLAPPHSATIHQDTPAVGAGPVTTQNGLSRGAPLQHGRNEGTTIGGGLCACSKRGSTRPAS